MSEQNEGKLVSRPADRVGDVVRSALASAGSDEGVSERNEGRLVSWLAASDGDVIRSALACAWCDDGESEHVCKLVRRLAGRGEDVERPELAQAECGRAGAETQRVRVEAGSQGERAAAEHARRADDSCVERLHGGQWSPERVEGQRVRSLRRLRVGPSGRDPRGGALVLTGLAVIHCVEPGGSPLDKQARAAALRRARAGDSAGILPQMAAHHSVSFNLSIS